MPAAISFGVSFSDFWAMTLREVKSVIVFGNNRLTISSEAEQAKNKWVQQEMAILAYNTAKLSRSKLPDGVEKVFPSLFGRTLNGNIPVEDWQACKTEMEKWRNAYRVQNNVRKRRGIDGNTNRCS